MFVLNHMIKKIIRCIKEIKHEVELVQEAIVEGSNGRVALCSSVNVGRSIVEGPNSKLIRFCSHKFEQTFTNIV